MVALLGMLALSQIAEFKPNAKLFEPYLLGSKWFVSGSKEVIDNGTERWVTLKSVQVTQFFAAKREAFMAAEGQKLFLLHATIKSPSKLPIGVSHGETFGLRIKDPGAKAEDYHYMGAVAESLDELTGSLKKNESRDVIVVLRAPAASTTLRLGLFYDSQGRNNTRWYDLTDKIEKPNSAFSSGPLTFKDTANLKLGQSADFDWVDIRVNGFRAVPGQANQYAVDVEVTNNAFQPAKWGWQYAAAALKLESGEAVAFYPELSDPATGKAWSGDIPAGKTQKLEYRFYPGREIRPKSFSLTSAATKRVLNVVL